MRQILVDIVFAATVCAGPVFASGGVEYTEEDEARAFASRLFISGTEFGTAAEAKAMLSRGIAAVKANEAAAILAFNRNDGQFRNRDLFVFCFNASDGTFTAHEALVGQNVRSLRDKTGAPFGELMYLAAKEDQIETVKYVSPMPGSTDASIRHARWQSSLRRQFLSV